MPLAVWWVVVRQQFCRRRRGGSGLSPMSGGSVPGSGHHDTAAPRTTDAGPSSSARRPCRNTAAARSRVWPAASPHFARGSVALFGGGKAATGSDPNDKPSRPKKNREAFEAPKMIDLGLRGMNEYRAGCGGTTAHRSGLDMRSKTMDNTANRPRGSRALEDFIGRKTLTGNERQNLESGSSRRGGRRWPSCCSGAKTWSAS